MEAPLTDDLMTDVSRQLGVLEGKVELMLETLKTNSDRDREDHVLIYKRMEGMQAELTKTTASVKHLDERWQASEKTLSNLERWRERGVGMVLLLGSIGVALGGALTIAWRWVAMKMGIN